MNGRKKFTTLLVSGALFAALTAVVTMYLRVLMVGGKISFNLGEGIIYLSAILMGRWVAMAAGGIGSALADLLAGPSIWTPFTLVIKAAEGFVVGTLASGKEGRMEWLKAILPGATLMIIGYFLSALLILKWPGALYELVTDLVQCTVGAVLALLLANPLRRQISLLQK